MSEAVLVDVFVEDRAHEEFIGALLRRLAREGDQRVAVRVRCARGGHGRALSELKLYQRSIGKLSGRGALPNLLVVAIDANCERFSAARDTNCGELDEPFRSLSAIACPDPHVERWYVADPVSFEQVVGASPLLPRRKCGRARYKRVLARAVAAGGHVPSLGGIEFARELVEAMDLFRAGKADRSLKAFLDEVRGHLQRL